MQQEILMEDLYAQRVGLPLWGTLLIYGVGTVAICVVNGVIGAGASFFWEGPLRSAYYGVVSAVVAGGISLFGLLFVILSPSLQREGPIVKMLGVILMATMILTYVQSKEPSAANVFESLVGYPPGEGVTELRSFISQAEWQDSTTGLQFHVDGASLERLVNAWNLKEALPMTRRISTIRDHASGIDPIPKWFANESALVKMKSWSWNESGSWFNVFLDIDNSVVYVIYSVM